jgi:6-phosphogluconate dehydrogenase
MEIAMVGLGKMGANMTRRLLQGGHRVVVSDLNEEVVATAVAEGARAAHSLDTLPGMLALPRAIWVMVPAGGPTESVINTLAEILSPGDLIIDGGNSNYKDTIRRADALQQKGIRFVDVGTSGGVWGLTEGYSLMVGGSDDAVAHLRPALETLAPGPTRGGDMLAPTAPVTLSK